MLLCKPNGALEGVPLSATSGEIAAGPLARAIAGMSASELAVRSKVGALEYVPLSATSGEIAAGPLARAIAGMSASELAVRSKVGRCAQ